MTPQTIYLATSGEYSDYSVLHAFARKEDADAYAIPHQVEEFELHDGPVETRTWHSLHWNTKQPDHDGKPGYQLANPYEVAYPKDFDGHPGACLHHFLPYARTLIVEGWDLDRVRKVYSEQRARIKAQEAGL
jgi:hypothetical protein